MSYVDYPYENQILVAENEALRDQVAKLTKDAGRYRWLRAEHTRSDPVCHLSWKRNRDRSSSEWVNTSVLDWSIDAAMQEDMP